jgi:YHS domain-containing protein
MMLIELFVPNGALSADRRRDVAERLLTELTYEENFTPAVLETVRDLFHVIVHEPDEWITGGRPAQPPYYLVRVSIPGGSMINDEGRAHYISTITRVLAETDEDPARFHREPLVCVHIVAVPGGDFGTLGQAMRESDLIKMMMGAGAGAPARLVEPGAETAVDPVCGMTVALTGTAITLQHDGATYVFCCEGCREVFAERVGVSA